MFILELFIFVSYILADLLLFGQLLLLPNCSTIIVVVIVIEYRFSSSRSLHLHITLIKLIPHIIIDVLFYFVF